MSKFTKGHKTNVGKKRSEETKKKISLSNFGKNHGAKYKGNEAGYSTLHSWINRVLPKPKICSNCFSDKHVDAANISGKYLRDISDWEWLCRKCHMIKDGRLKNLEKTQFKKLAL